MNVSTSSINKLIIKLLDGSFYSIGGVVETPLIHAEYLSELSGCNLYLKCENLQTTGSFKIRGATSALVNLSASDKSKGVVTASSGNHGAATATAAKAQGIPVSIYVPTSISLMKEEKITNCGASLIKIEGGGENAEREASRVAQEKSLTYISPYNHPDIIAGQGTIAAELLSQLPDLDIVFVSVGGGGLISGIGSRLKYGNPEVQIVACWPENATSMLECIRAGKIIDVEETQTLSDGTAGGVEENAVTLPLCQQVISDTITVSENEIAQAMKLVFQHHGYKIEGAAGVALAGLLKKKQHYQGKNVVIVLCGANISDQSFDMAMSMIDD